MGSPFALHGTHVHHVHHGLPCDRQKRPRCWVQPKGLCCEPRCEPLPNAPPRFGGRLFAAPPPPPAPLPPPPPPLTPLPPPALLPAFHPAAAFGALLRPALPRNPGGALGRANDVAQEGMWREAASGAKVRLQ